MNRNTLVLAGLAALAIAVYLYFSKVATAATPAVPTEGPLISVAGTAPVPYVEPSTQPSSLLTPAQEAELYANFPQSPAGAILNDIT